MGAEKYRAVFMVVASLSVALLLISGVRWHAQLTSARMAVGELAECRAIATRIASLRAIPQSASLEKQTPQQITLYIQRAAQVAEIPDSDLLRVTPQPGRRVPRSPHIEQPTTVEIRQTSLGQLSRFLSELSVLDVGLQPTSIRLTAPRTPPAETQTEVWGCELVLTYLLFSPE